MAARLPVAPPLLIGAIGALRTFDISSAKILPVTSAKPPAGKATTISIGLEGYFSCDQDRVVLNRERSRDKTHQEGFYRAIESYFLLLSNQKPKIPFGSLIFSHSSNIAKLPSAAALAMPKDRNQLRSSMQPSKKLSRINVVKTKPKPFQEEGV